MHPSGRRVFDKDAICFFLINSKQIKPKFLLVVLCLRIVLLIIEKVHKVTKICYFAELHITLKPHVYLTPLRKGT